jgi:hypothetical protein
VNPAITESIYSDNLYAIKEPFVVVIDTPWAEISEAEKMLLSKILLSVRQSLFSVKLIYSKEYTSVNTGQTTIFLFGTKHTPDIDYYSLSNINGNRLIQAHKLSELDDGRKKDLWAAIKQLMVPPA